jgi:hypothetical protein
MSDVLRELLTLIKANDGLNNKARLARIVADTFHLTLDRSVYYCAHFAIRFSSSASRNFGNTVLSLSNLRKYDDRPFIVCLVTPTTNYCLLANTTFLKKVSHSSQALRENNIRGSLMDLTWLGSSKESLTPQRISAGYTLFMQRSVLMVILSGWWKQQIIFLPQARSSELAMKLRPPFWSPLILLC